MRIARRVAYWLRFRAREAELRAEIAFHREQLANDLERRGLSPDAARIAARREMGNETYMREEARVVWLSAGIDGALQDARYAWRSLRRSPAFTAVVVVTLAMAIGANTAIFTVVHRLLLAPLPYPEGNRIVQLETVAAANPDVPLGVSTPRFQQWQARSRTLENFSSIKQDAYHLGPDAERDAVRGASVTSGFMTLLRLRPALGRDFTAADARVGAAPVTILGYALWQARYNGAVDILGKVIPVDGQSRTVVGVAPAHLGVPVIDGEEPDVWLPMSAESGSVERFARLRPRATVVMASRELQAIMREPPVNGTTEAPADTTLRARVLRPQDQLDAHETHAIEILLLATGGLLLIACANIANLLLMRAWTRQRELVVRRALGASRLRLVRHALAESLLLAAAGGALGLVVAWRGLHTIVALRPDALSDLANVHVDTAVLLWTTAIALLSGLLFGIAPALLSGAQSMGNALRAGVRTAVGSAAARRLRGGMVVAEVALSVVFLVAAGLLVRSFIALERTSIGYDRTGLVVVSYRLAHRPRPADRDAIEQTLMQSVTRVAGTGRAALGAFPGGLLQTTVRPGPYAIQGPNGAQEVDLQFCETPFVGPGYFHVLGLPLLQGRGFDTAQHVGPSHELVVNQALARRLWPNGNALGAKLRVGDGARATWLTVVGIAGDLRLPGSKFEGDLFKLQMYRPANEAGEMVSSIVLRVREGTSTAALQATLERAVEDAGVGATVQSVDPAESTFDRRVLARPRFALVLFGLFAVIALAVSAVGLYAIVAYAVTQRTREIGLRVALGAAPSAVARLVLGASARLVALGGCIGLFAAYGASRALMSFLGGMKPSDPVVFGGAVVALGVVALVASVVPMRRAMGVDPVEALRAD
ncbi:MAG TPA: ADOP family duplicated permease [Gemmatimonadaceae bacterium]|nr:ADOP family duplicated permease [Gemmatimonadaceae bacterium]